ncbi:uncharacterized protein LOC133374713 isoform X3 [Rhineura floridana]|uniref:uncharacterized protein LOC133374713 isoform X3 n=1 Tax=Rhineura floridana TaxID=261503 RepID=UPI002AC80289|nr:uncharacterized protein LOC133374713 isoform X3 [Rhineura floridana]
MAAAELICNGSPSFLGTLWSAAILLPLGQRRGVEGCILRWCHVGAVAEERVEAGQSGCPPRQGHCFQPPQRSFGADGIRAEYSCFLTSLEQEAAIGMTTFFVVFLVPSGWILANLEHYKSRE